MLERARIITAADPSREEEGGEKREEEIPEERAWTGKFSVMARIARSCHSLTARSFVWITPVLRPSRSSLRPVRFDFIPRRVESCSHQVESGIPDKTYPVTRRIFGTWPFRQWMGWISNVPQFSFGISNLFIFFFPLET